MNVYDSEQISKALKRLGYEMAPYPDIADVVIVNTCAIRKKAEQKAFSFLGRLAGLKRKKPNLIVGIGGCVAQQEGEKLLERWPFLDLVFGTRAIHRLPQMVAQIESKRCRMVDVDGKDAPTPVEPIPDVEMTGRATRFVTVMQGCDNFCTYCVVPYVRGREVSRDPESILKEIRKLVESGVHEVTLLGQNVNSYGKKEGLCSFPQLLARIDEIDGLKRIRFTTSHPKDISDELIDGFRELGKLCNHIHLPVQSGSDRILKRMNRKYTREQYHDRVEKLRKCRPDMAITSDIIVGFPGETRTDFQETVDLIKQIEYDSLYVFMYSDRPNASAAGFSGKIPEAEKKERLLKILQLQKQYTMKKARTLIGSVLPVLVEGLSRRHSSEIRREEFNLEGRGHQEVQWTGRTSTNKIVNFILDPDNPYGHNDLRGKLVEARIEKAFSNSLWGKLVQVEPDTPGLKGEESYAA